MRKVYRYPAITCLNCGYKLDAAMSAEGEERAPQAGDASICAECSHIMVYTENCGVRNPTAAELDEITKQDDVFKALVALARARAEYHDD